MKIDPSQIEAWAAEYAPDMPAPFFSATAKRESGYNPNSVLNETNGTTSIGLEQVNVDEARAAKEPDADLSDPETNVRVFCKVTLQRKAALIAKYNLDASNLPDDFWYYLAAAHNAGLGKVYEWIDELGGKLDWSATSAAHSGFSTIARGYADYIGRAAVGGITDQAANAVADASQAVNDTIAELTGDQVNDDTDPTKLIIFLLIGLGILWSVSA